MTPEQIKALGILRFSVVWSVLFLGLFAWLWYSQVFLSERSMEGLLWASLWSVMGVMNLRRVVLSALDISEVKVDHSKAVDYLKKVE